MEFKEWLTKLIVQFREESGKLSDKQLKYLSNLDNFQAPCQVDVLWIENEELARHYQVLFFTHFKNEPDMEFNIFKTSEPYRFYEIAEQMLDNPKWDKKLPRSEANHFTKEIYSYQTYRDYLILALSNQYMMMKQYFSYLSLKAPIASRVDSPGKQALFNETGSSMWDVWGDITTVNPRSIVDSIIRDARTYFNVQKQKRSLPVKGKPVKTYTGNGALILPRMWIGKLPEQTLKDRIERNYYAAKTIIKTKYKDSIFVFRQDGFMGVLFESSTDENYIIAKSLEYLNEVIATFVILDIPVYAIRESDLIKISVDPKTFRITGMTWQSGGPGNESLLHQQDMWGTVLPSNLSEERHLIKSSLVRKGVTEAEKLTANQATRNSLLFLSEAHTLFDNSEFPQSFLSSWIIIEHYIRTLWDEFIKAKETNKRRVRKLLDQNYLDIDHILETLHLSNKLGVDGYSLFMKLKKIRNSIVHSGKAISGKEAEECLQLASNITKSQCNLV